MTITISEVQEIIKNLEGSGELSIKEEKHLNVAKLCVHLAAENVGLKGAIPQLKNIDYQNESMDDVTLAEEIGFNAAVMAMYRWVPKTPVTDRIVAGIKADEEKAVLNDLLRHLDKIDIENLSSPWELSSEVVAFVNSRLLRDGADK